MPRVAWLTDIHLDLLKRPEREGFYYDVAEHEPDAVLIGGDISEARSLIARLEELEHAWRFPVYFVLGNHDFFFSSIRDVRREVDSLVARSSKLIYLTHSDPIELSAETALVGHDGWADARLGDYTRSVVTMLDYSLIGEFAGLGKERRWQLLKGLADRSADEARPRLESALARHSHVYFLTHIPPFREACWHDGKISDDQWLPHFTSQAMGDMLCAVMADHPTRQLTVLCGHTHGAGEAPIRDNLLVLTGGATYGVPTVQRVFDV